MKNEITRHTHRYPCFTEFNFQELLVWDTNNTVRVSLLNNNLVVIRPDYIVENRETVSFLGTNDIDDTCMKLIKYSKTNKNDIYLHNLPEFIAKKLSKKLFVCIREFAFDDYIIDVNAHASLKGKTYESYRSKLNKFLRSYGHCVETKILDMSKKTTYQQFHDLFSRWIYTSNKSIKDSEHELQAINRVFAFHSDLDLRVEGVFIDSKLAGCTIQAMLPGGYEIGLFLKADYTYERIFNYIVSTTSKSSQKYGNKFMNIEHDLGLPNLREAKMQLHPSHFFKKYRVTTI